MDFNKSTYISSNTTTVIGTGNVKLYSVVIPVALTGTATFEDAAGSDYFVLPIASVGCFIFRSVFGNGLSVVTSASDKLIVNSAQ